MDEPKIRVYVAGPYSSDPEGHTLRAIDAGEELLKAGLAPFVPHLSHYWDAQYKHSWDVWMAWCFAWLRTCHALVRLPGVSVGANQEESLARSLGIPVFYFTTSCIEWAKEQK